MVFYVRYSILCLFLFVYAFEQCLVGGKCSRQRVPHFHCSVFTRAWIFIGPRTMAANRSIWTISFNSWPRLGFSGGDGAASPSHALRFESNASTQIFLILFIKYITFYSKFDYYVLVHKKLNIFFVIYSACK